MPKLRIIQIIHLAFCASILLFALVVGLLIAPNATFTVSFGNEEPAAFIAPVFALASFFLSTVLFNKILGNVAEEQVDTDTKLVRYQTSFLVKCALLEAPALFNIVTALLTSNFLFFIFAGICLVALWQSRPTKEAVYTTLQIQDTDSF